MTPMAASAQTPARVPTTLSAVSLDQAGNAPPKIMAMGHLAGPPALCRAEHTIHTDEVELATPS